MSKLDFVTPALVLALACTPGEPGGTAGSTGGSTTAPTGSTTGVTGSTGTATAPTSGGSGTTSSGTGDTTTAGATSSSTTAITGVSAGTTGDTGGPLACEVADGDYGPCASELGWAFDGTECRLISGCDCAPDCDNFFPDAAACALTCAAAGRCNEERIKAAGIAADPIQAGALCDEIDVCPDDPARQQIFEAIFGMLTCEGAGFPCEGGSKCTGLFQNMLGPDEWLKTCAASLVWQGGDVFCVVWGP